MSSSHSSSPVLKVPNISMLSLRDVCDFMKSFKVIAYENNRPSSLPSFIHCTFCKQWKFAYKRVRLLYSVFEKKIRSRKLLPSRISFELLDSLGYLLSEAFVNSGDIDLNPGPAGIPILLAYGRRFMCSQRP